MKWLNSCSCPWPLRIAHRSYWEIWGWQNEYDNEYQNRKSRHWYSKGLYVKLPTFLFGLHDGAYECTKARTIWVQLSVDGTKSDCRTLYWYGFLIMKEELFLFILGEHQLHRAHRFWSGHAQVEWILQNNNFADYLCFEYYCSCSCWYCQRP